MNRRIRRQIAIALLTVTLSISLGCGKGDKENTALTGDSRTRSTQIDRASGTDNYHHAGVRDKYRKYEWTPEQIEERHRELLLAPMPEYAQDIRGKGGMPSEMGRYASWGFVVPEEHIEDFKNYLRDKLGLPEEVIDKKNFHPKTRCSKIFNRGADREEPSWKPPDPPAEKVIFIYALESVADITLDGLLFEEGDAIILTFDNPNLANACILLTFSARSGNVHVSEKVM